MDAGAYAVRLRDLEQRINELKEQIFRSKTRLSLLAETVLGVVVAGSQVVITVEPHQLFGAFTVVLEITSALYVSLLWMSEHSIVGTPLMMIPLSFP